MGLIMKHPAKTKAMDLKDSISVWIYWSDREATTHIEFNTPVLDTLQRPYNFTNLLSTIFDAITGIPYALVYLL